MTTDVKINNKEVSKDKQDFDTFISEILKDSESIEELVENNWDPVNTLRNAIHRVLDYSEYRQEFIDAVDDFLTRDDIETNYFADLRVEDAVKELREKIDTYKSSDLCKRLNPPIPEVAKQSLKELYTAVRNVQQTNNFHKDALLDAFNYERETLEMIEDVLPTHDITTINKCLAKNELIKSDQLIEMIEFLIAFNYDVADKEVVDVPTKTALAKLNEITNEFYLSDYIFDMRSKRTESLI